MALPPQLKSIQHHLRTAQEHEKRDPVVAYYCEFASSGVIALAISLAYKLLALQSQDRSGCVANSLKFNPFIDLNVGPNISPVCLPDALVLAVFGESSSDGLA